MRAAQKAMMGELSQVREKARNELTDGIASAKSGVRSSTLAIMICAVVIIGGRGSLEGAAIGALFIGLLNTFGQVWFPQLAYFVIFGPMAVLLAFRRGDSADRSAALAPRPRIPPATATTGRGRRGSRSRRPG